jgi:hypothetical protein
VLQSVARECLVDSTMSDQAMSGIATWYAPRGVTYIDGDGQDRGQQEFVSRSMHKVWGGRAVPLAQKSKTADFSVSAGLIVGENVFEI